MTTETFYINEENLNNINNSKENDKCFVEVLTRFGLARSNGISTNYHYSFQAKFSDLNMNPKYDQALLRVDKLQKLNLNFKLFNLVKSIGNYRATGTPTDLTVEQIEKYILIQSKIGANKRRTLLVAYSNISNLNERYGLVPNFEEQTLEIVKVDGNYNILENALTDVDDSCFTLDAVSDALEILRVIIEG